MSVEFVFTALLVVFGLALFFSLCRVIIASYRFRKRYGELTRDYEAELIRNAAQRDAYEDIARFAREYYGDPNFSSKIRQLYYTRTECPECNGKGKRWQNSIDKCEHCWGTGKQLKD